MALSEIQRRKVASADELQMCILFLERGFSANTIQREILKLGGKPTLYLPGQGVMCAQIRTSAVAALKGVMGIRHVSPGFFKSRVRKLTVKTDSQGKALWRYEVDDRNNIHMVKSE